MWVTEGALGGTEGVENILDAIPVLGQDWHTIIRACKVEESNVSRIV